MFFSGVRALVQWANIFLFTLGIAVSMQSYALNRTTSSRCDANAVLAEHFSELADSARRSGDTISLLVWAQDCAGERRMKGYLERLWELGSEPTKTNADLVFSEPIFRLQLAQLFASELVTTPNYKIRLEEIHRYVRSHWTSTDPSRQMYSLAFYVKLRKCDVDELEAIALREESMAIIIVATLIHSLGTRAEPRIQSILRKWPRHTQNPERLDFIQKKFKFMPNPELAYVEGECKPHVKG